MVSYGVAAGKKRKTEGKNVSVVHGNKIQAHTRVHRAEIAQAAKPCAKPSLFYGERKKEVGERTGDKGSNRECAHVTEEKE